MEDIVQRYLSGDRRALARLISLIENEAEQAAIILDQIYDRTGRAYRIGITGPPGAGKSTIVDQLTKQYRQQNRTVGIIAVDPTSPFTGGALLGDRIRMNDLATDPGVFIRSMASRGSLGGLARRSQEVADLLDGFGFDVVIFETVGVGQSELDVVEAADSTVVVLVPESGDSIQAMKAGLMEIADIFAINKSDREGADRVMLEIQFVLGFSEDSRPWKPPIIQTVANSGQGISQLHESLEQHLAFQNRTQLRIQKRKRRIENYVRQIVNERIMRKFWESSQQKRLAALIEQILNKQRSPYAVSNELIQEFRKLA
ncbi:MAG: methylmalonyl Co-A mutase-associated GTPase MeaB [candidate division KSB1 bacterium]|nr:methylmalonyl Co-A mutase-associated GTPase MeaB [candidate division KSB1 bacterium]MDZ7336578.1 methylmalonyl Co-A mutase-associated GTPase MeaB [candidate division KSB1 bacterium]MDZ7399001.1 methylmalonyl Co-A mutase-associated GTPase MeaB [candidate division KSB1 bacterium]